MTKLMQVITGLRIVTKSTDPNNIEGEEIIVGPGNQPIIPDHVVIAWKKGKLLRNNPRTHTHVKRIFKDVDEMMLNKRNDEGV